MKSRKSFLPLLGLFSVLSSVLAHAEGNVIVNQAAQALRAALATETNAATLQKVASVLGFGTSKWEVAAKNPEALRSELLNKLSATNDPAIHEKAAQLLGRKPDVVDVSKVVASKPGLREELGLSEFEYARFLRSQRVLTFYSTNEPYGEFSNFTRYPVLIDGKLYQTSEHYFQSQKFAGSARDEEEVRIGGSPREIAAMGRDRNRPLRKEWEAVKDDVMRKAVHAKFTQHPELRALLMSTGERYLVEHTENDRYWGDGKSGVGPNMLGKILMETRAKLYGDEALPTAPARSVFAAYPAIGPADFFHKILANRATGFVSPQPPTSVTGFLRYLSAKDAGKLAAAIAADDESVWEVAPYSRLAIESYGRKVGVSDAALGVIPVVLPEAVFPDGTKGKDFLIWLNQRMTAFMMPFKAPGALMDLERVFFEALVVSATFTLTTEDLEEIERLIRAESTQYLRGGRHSMRDDDVSAEAKRLVDRFLRQELWGRDGVRLR